MTQRRKEHAKPAEPDTEAEATAAAFLPEPEARKAKTYLVTGAAKSTLGHKPGEEFTALLPPEQEASLIAAGAIAIKPAPAGGDDKE